MRFQLRFNDGRIINKEYDNIVDLIDRMSDTELEKISCDFLDGSRLVLRSDGTYQIFGGLVNYPHLTETN